LQTLQREIDTLQDRIRKTEQSITEQSVKVSSLQEQYDKTAKESLGDTHDAKFIDQLSNTLVHPPAQ